MSKATNNTNTKKRKLDSKPQSQINKCLNEKRRREQENIYIEELAELISASIADMSANLSVKPDKCAILQETVNQIRRIKQEDNTIQQGEVSSSTTNILANEILCPLVLEALDGFLFIVNSDGITEYVSENVQLFINYPATELTNQSIYNYIHLNDHGKFSSILLPMSAGWQSAVATTSSNTSNPNSPSPRLQRSFNIRLSIKSDDGNGYENMQISSIQTPTNANVTSLVCIARRLPPNERLPGGTIEQFTTKLLIDGHLIGIDNSGVSAGVKEKIGKELIGSLLQDLCHPLDLPKLNSHLKETLSAGSSTCPIYRIHLGEKYFQVTTKSKLFAFNANTEPDFIMATHTIIGTPSMTNPSSPATSSAPTASPLPLPQSLNQSLPPTSPPDTNNNESAAEFTTFSLHAASNSSSDYDYNDFTWGMMEEEDPSLGGGMGGPSSWLQNPHTHQPPPPIPMPILQSHPSQQSHSHQAQGIPQLPPPEPQQQTSPNDGDKLRMLLTNRGGSENRILKGLLASDDEGSSQSAAQSDNMLIKLLNDKSEETKHPSTELWNILNEGNGRREVEDAGQAAFNKQQQLAALKTQKPGELCKKNPQLVHLLSKQLDRDISVPQVPTSLISASPNERFIQNTKHQEQQRQQHLLQQQQQQQQQQSIHQQQILQQNSPQTPPTHLLQQQQQHLLQSHQPNSPSSQQHLTLHHQTPPPQYVHSPQQLQQQTGHGLSLPGADELLDTILEQVIDIVPDSHLNIQPPTPPPSATINHNLLHNAQQPMETNTELAMINAIQKELMQYENNTLGQQPPPNYNLHQPLYIQRGPDAQPLYIQRTTTTTTTMTRFRGVGNNGLGPLAAGRNVQQQPLSPQHHQQQLLQNSQLQQQQAQAQARLLHRRKQLQLQAQLQQQHQLQLLQQQQQQQQQHSQQLSPQPQQHRPAMSLDTLLNQGPPNVTIPPQANRLNQNQQLRAQQVQQPNMQFPQQRLWRIPQTSPGLTAGVGMQNSVNMQQTIQQNNIQVQNPMLNAQLAASFPTGAGNGNVVQQQQQQQSMVMSRGVAPVQGQVPQYDYRMRQQNSTLNSTLNSLLSQGNSGVQQMQVGSEFVRQELRAMVGARRESSTPGGGGQQQQQTTQVPDFDAIGFPFPE